MVIPAFLRAVPDTENFLSHPVLYDILELGFGRPRPRKLVRKREVDAQIAAEYAVDRPLHADHIVGGAGIRFGRQGNAACGDPVKAVGNLRVFGQHHLVARQGRQGVPRRIEVGLRFLRFRREVDDERAVRRFSRPYRMEVHVGRRRARLERYRIPLREGQLGQSPRRTAPAVSRRPRPSKRLRPVELRDRPHLSVVVTVL